jgi:hypothetical protein
MPTVGPQALIFVVDYKQKPQVIISPGVEKIKRPRKIHANYNDRVLRSAELAATGRSGFMK